MATSSSPPIAPSASDSAASAPSELIAARLMQTRRYVKFIDLCTGVATLLVGILAYLLIVALVDHWILDLGPGMRLACLLILLGGVAAFFVWRLLPPLLYPVNPVYAAQAIEQGAPSLKNSLINLVLLSGQRSGVPSVIYEGLRRQAAGQLAQVPPETMVDRGPLIKAGYWLVALLALAAAYKVLSPKDPLRSVARIAAPWKDIDRPARVKIQDVQPGDADVYRGQTIDVTARIDGLGEDEIATLYYSTSDRQFIDQPIVLVPLGAQRYRGTLTMGERGIQQSMVYRLQAGDTRTQDFQVQLQDTPHIAVVGVRYQYPAYTELDERVVEGQGDLSAVEGTRVQIEAEANQTIDKAFLELFAGTSVADAHDLPPSQAIPMRVEGKRASGKLTLLLQPDRKTPQVAAYRIRFTTPDGQRNERPSRYQIEVTPDLEPDVEILQPRSRDLEIPENGAVTIEVRAYDPDFAVREVRLTGAAGGQTRLDVALLEQPQVGPVVQKYRLMPARLGLAAGDVMIYWAEAEDNRCAATGAAAPNSKRTANYRLRVIAADPSQTPNDATDSGSEGEATGSESGAGETGGTGEEGSKAGESDQGESDQDGTDQDGTDQDGTDQAGDRANPPQSGESGDESSEGEPQGSDQGGSEAESGDSTAGEQQGGSRTGTDGESRSEGEQAEEPSSEGATGDDAGSGESDGRPSSDQAARSGETLNDAPDGQGSDPARSGDPGQGVRQAGPSDDSTDDTQPVPSDGSDDAEAFERILRHMRRERRNESDPSDVTQKPPTEDRSSDSGSNQTSNGQRDGTQPPSPSGQPEDADRSPAKSPRGDGESSSEKRPEAREVSEPPEGQPAADEATDPNQASNGNSSSGDPEKATSDPSANDTKPPTSPTDGGAPGAGVPAERQPPSNPAAEPSGETPAGRPETGPPESSGGRSTPESGEGTPAEAQGEGDSPRPANSAEDGQGQTSRSPSGSQAGNAQDESSSGAEADDLADEANLEYARRATDMALEYLKDQQQTDQLRERLGWTEEEMRAFVRRWEQMQRDTRQQGNRGKQAQRHLQDQLRGLGLQPPAERVRSGSVAKDPLQQIRQGGSEVPIPAEYLEQYRAFLKSAPSSRDRNDEGGPSR